jgi:heat shock protein HslJ
MSFAPHKNMLAKSTLLAAAFGLFLSNCTMKTPSVLSQKSFILQGSSTLKDSFPAGYPSIVFSDSMGFSGFSGCNRIFGAYTADNSIIGFLDIISTKMFCSGVAEDWFLQQLETADRYHFQDSVLRLYHDNSLLLTFKQEAK